MLHFDTIQLKIGLLARIAADGQNAHPTTDIFLVRSADGQNAHPTTDIFLVRSADGQNAHPTTDIFLVR
ncbi:hypothetical protein [Microseira sp. BLCC-F43]|uniref:hypothetical protein n=1 Tax=Microseira sp. BLCC-F43 TaxID=3153602 RepID=UPI0035B994CE